MLLLTPSPADAVQSAAASTVSPISSSHVGTAQWKPIQEDSTPWQREPFKNLDSLARLPGQPAKQGFTGASPDFALHGIMKSRKHFYAIINGRTVKSGDSIDGWSVAEISRYRVTLRREKEKQVYDIYQGRIDRGTR
jgi:hypothetical protein